MLISLFFGIVSLCTLFGPKFLNEIQAFHFSKFRYLLPSYNHFYAYRIYIISINYFWKSMEYSGTSVRVSALLCEAEYSAFNNLAITCSLFQKYLLLCIFLYIFTIHCNCVHCSITTFWHIYLNIYIIYLMAINYL